MPIASPPPRLRLPLLIGLVAGCVSAAGAGCDKTKGNDPYRPCVAVVREYKEIDGVAAPPNAVTGDETPARYNKVRYIRFRADTGDDPPLPAKAILVLLPGFTVGSGYLTYMAQSVVERSCGQIEVWAAERRHHLLEDPKGMIAAEEAGDPRVAIDYYWGGSTVDDATFAGFRDGLGPDTAILAEWGLEIALEDTRRIIEQIPAGDRQATVFLGGHSRGVAYVKAFAAYEFGDGRLGCEDLAGLVLVDGDNQYDPDLTESEYLDELDAIRRGERSRFVAVPPADPPIYTVFELLAMAAAEGFGDPDDPELGPDGQWTDFGPLAAAVPLLYRFKNIQITNEAFFGLALDSESGIIEILKAGFGKLDGPTAEDGLGVYPTDESHLYRWRDFDEVNPPEFCHIQDIIHALYEGPSNAVDPYYAARLDLDFFVADHLETAGSWRETYFTFRSSEMDAPVYTLGSHLLSAEPERVTSYGELIPPVRDQSLPRSEYGFDILWKTEWEHIDTIFANAPTNDFFTDIIAWMLDFSTGEVQLD